MDHLSLETLAEHLVAQSRGAHEEVCRLILHQVTRGKPLAPATLAASLQVSQTELERRLTQFPDLEYNHTGQIIGLGLTLIPTSHRVQVRGQRLFTWCAFDTLLFPASLHLEAQVESTCPVTGQSITFVATSEGVIKDLVPADSVMSLIVPAARQDCGRDTFCQQSHFFQSEEAASSWLSEHPGALLLSLEEAAFVGKLVAQKCSMDAG